MYSLSFHEQGGSIPPRLLSDIESWLPHFCQEHKLSSLEANVILMSDEELLDLNRQLLDHDYYTDIITVPIEHPGLEFCGDLYVSVDRIKENAQEYGSQSFSDELVRVIAHGILHLLGYNDKTDEEQQAMKLEEERALELFRKM